MAPTVRKSDEKGKPVSGKTTGAKKDPSRGTQGRNTNKIEEKQPAEPAAQPVDVKTELARKKLRDKGADIFTHIELTDVQAIIEAMVPNVMPATRVVDVLKLLDDAIKERGARMALLSLGFFNQLMPYFKMESIRIDLLTFLYGIFCYYDDNITQDVADIDEIVASDLAIPKHIRPHLSVAWAEDRELYRQLYQTMFILAKLCNSEAGRSEVVLHQCLAPCVKLWNTNTPTDVLALSFTIVLRCLEHGAAPADTVVSMFKIHFVEEISQTTDFLEDVFKDYLQSDYRVIQKLILRLLPHLVHTNKVRLHFLHRNGIDILTRLLDEKAYSDVHELVYPVLLILWMKNEAVLLSCCNNFLVMKRVMRHLERNMLETVKDAKIMLRTLHGFTFHLHKEEVVKLKGRVRFKTAVEEPAAVQTFVSDHLQLLVHLSIDLYVTKLLSRLDAFPEREDRGSLAFSSLSLLALWWKENQTVLERQLLANDCQLASQLIEFLAYEECPETGRIEFSMPAVSLLAIQTVTWAVQISMPAAQCFGLLPKAIRQLMDVVRMFSNFPRHYPYALRALCSLITSSERVAKRVVAAGFTEQMVNFLYTSTIEEDDTLEEQVLTALSCALKYTQEEVTVDFLKWRGVRDLRARLADNISAIQEGGVMLRNLRCLVSLTLKLCDDRRVVRECFRENLMFQLFFLLSDEYRAKLHTMYGAEVRPIAVRLNNLLIDKNPTVKFIAHGILDEKDSVLDEFFLDTSQPTVVKSGNQVHDKAAMSPESLIGDGVHKCDRLYIPMPNMRPIPVQGGFYEFTSDTYHRSCVRFLELIETCRVCVRDLEPGGPGYITRVLGILARVVFQALGGEVQNHCEMLANVRDSALAAEEDGPMPVTALSQGAFTERSLLFKGLCDYFGIPCRLHRSPQGNRMWTQVTKQEVDLSMFWNTDPRYARYYSPGVGISEAKIRAMAMDVMAPDADETESGYQARLQSVQAGGEHPADNCGQGQDEGGMGEMGTSAEVQNDGEYRHEVNPGPSSTPGTRHSTCSSPTSSVTPSSDQSTDSSPTLSSTSSSSSSPDSPFIPQPPATWSQQEAAVDPEERPDSWDFSQPAWRAPITWLGLGWSLERTLFPPVDGTRMHRWFTVDLAYKPGLMEPGSYRETTYHQLA